MSNSERKPNDGPPRWRTWAIVDIAAFILKHGTAMRKALKLDGMAPDEVPTLHERLVEAEAGVSALNKENEQLKKDLSKKTDAHRKAAKRLADAGQAKRDAVRTVREAERAKCTQRIADARERCAEKAAAAAAVKVAAAATMKAAAKQSKEAVVAEAAAASVVRWSSRFRIGLRRAFSHTMT